MKWFLLLVISFFGIDFGWAKEIPVLSSAESASLVDVKIAKKAHGKFSRKSVIRYGDYITLRHVPSNAYLHSHNIKYRHGHSERENKYTQITALGGGNQDDWFIVLPENEGDYGKDVTVGSKVLLRHAETNENMQFHMTHDGKALKSPSGFGFVCGRGNHFGYWTILGGTQGEPLKVGAQIQLQDASSPVKPFLATNAEMKFDVNNSSNMQQEVFCIADSADENTRWEVEGYFPMLPENKEGGLVAYNQGVPQSVVDYNGKVGGHGKEYHLRLANGVTALAEGSWFKLIVDRKTGEIGIESRRADYKRLQARGERKIGVKKGSEWVDEMGKGFKKIGSLFGSKKKKTKDATDIHKIVFYKHEVLFKNHNFRSYERWQIVPTMYGTFKLKSAATGGYLCNPGGDWSGNYLWTTMDSRKGKSKEEELNSPANFSQGLDFSFNSMGVSEIAKITSRERIIINPNMQSIPFGLVQKNIEGSGKDVYITFDVKAEHGLKFKLSNDKSSYDIFVDYAGSSFIKKSGINKRLAFQDKVDVVNRKNKTPMWIRYRIKDGVGKLAVGTGELNSNVIVSYEDKEPLKDLKYLGFGATGSYAKFTNIRINGEGGDRVHMKLISGDSTENDEKSDEEAVDERDPEIQASRYMFYRFDKIGGDRKGYINIPEGYEDVKDPNKEAICYGDLIKLYFGPSRGYLHVSGKNYEGKESSGGSQVVLLDRDNVYDTVENATWWRVVTTDMKDMLGKPLSSKEDVWLQPFGYEKCLGVNENIKAPATKDGLEVSLYPQDHGYLKIRLDQEKIQAESIWIPGESKKEKTKVFNTRILRIQEPATGLYLTANFSHVTEEIEDGMHQEVFAAETQSPWIARFIARPKKKVAIEEEKEKTVKEEKVEKVIEKVEEDLDDDLVVPQYFSKKEAPNFAHLAVGTYNGRIEMWGVGKDRKSLYMMQSGKLTQSFETVPTKISTAGMMTAGRSLEKITDVVISHAGNVYVIAESKLYQFDREAKTWSAIDTGTYKLKSFATQDDEVMWCVDLKGFVREKTAEGWTARSGEGVGVQVVIGYDSTIIALNGSGMLFKYDTSSSQWQELTAQGKSLGLRNVALVDNYHVYGVSKDDQVVHYNKDEDQLKILQTSDGKENQGFSSIALSGSAMLLLSEGGITFATDLSSISSVAVAKMKEKDIPLNEIKAEVKTEEVREVTRETRPSRPVRPRRGVDPVTPTASSDRSTAVDSRRQRGNSRYQRQRVR